MLHRIQLPDCVPQLEQIRQFQRDVLVLACSSETVLPLTQEALQESLNEERGSWLWSKLWKRSSEPKESDFHRALIAVIEFVQTKPEIGPIILDAFDHDVAFHSSLEDPDFRFQFHTFHIDIQNILKPLMVSFYEDLLKAGFGTDIHGQPEKLNRDAFISSFWGRNPELEVCPACDDNRSDVIGKKHYDDADHYFPKSKYPFLSLHHANLVPLCLECNRSFKGQHDPIDDPDNAPLLNIFLPYHRPAVDYVDFVVSRDDKGVPHIEFEDHEYVPSRRVENFKRVFRLSARWPNDLREQMKRLVEDIGDAGHRLRRYTEITEDVFRVELNDMTEKKVERIGKRPNHILQSSYLRFALENDDEFQGLFREFVGD